MNSATLYRVTMFRRRRSKPELWTNYGTAGDAELAARGLIGSGIAIRSEVTEVTGSEPSDRRFVVGFELKDGKIERFTKPANDTNNNQR